MEFMVARVNLIPATFAWRVDLIPSTDIFPLSMFVLGMVLLGAPLIWLSIEMFRDIFHTP